MPKARKPYSGVLLKPAPLLTDGNPQEIARYFEDSMAKLFALLDHYGIAQDAEGGHWFLLAYALAKQHVEAFKPRQLDLGKVFGKTVTDDILIFTALGGAELSNKSVKQAALNLTKKRKSRLHGRGKEGIRQRYYTLKRGFKTGSLETFRMVALIQLLTSKKL